VSPRVKTASDLPLSELIASETGERSVAAECSQTKADNGLWREQTTRTVRLHKCARTQRRQNESFNQLNGVNPITFIAVTQLCSHFALRNHYSKHHTRTPTLRQHRSFARSLVQRRTTRRAAPRAACPAYSATDGRPPRYSQPSSRLVRETKLFARCHVRH